MAYTSTTLTLAMAEFLAHVNIDDLDPDDPPALVYVEASIPGHAVRTIAQLRLPRNWSAVPAPAGDAALGDAWVSSGTSVAIVVPSVHVPIETPERNVLINPLHRDFRSVTTAVRRFSYDERLVAARVRASTARSRETRRA